MTSNRYTVPALFVLFALSIFALIISVHTTPAFGSSPSGLAARIATTSNPTITNSAVLLVASSSNSCNARIITTSASPLMLTFTDRIGQRPTGSFGHLQPASTTVAYDSGQFGCDAVYAYSFTSQVITVSSGN